MLCGKAREVYLGRHLVAHDHRQVHEALDETGQAIAAALSDQVLTSTDYDLLRFMVSDLCFAPPLGSDFTSCSGVVLGTRKLLSL